MQYSVSLLQSLFRLHSHVPTFANPLNEDTYPLHDALLLYPSQSETALHRPLGSAVHVAPSQYSLLCEQSPFLPHSAQLPRSNDVAPMHISPASHPASDLHRPLGTATHVDPEQYRASLQ